MNFRAYAAELIATFTLTFIGTVAIIATKSEASAGIITIALAHGLALSMAIYATAHISGAHVNPAVTVGMLVTKQIKPPDAIDYIVAQLAGATIAALILKGFFPNAVDPAVRLGATLGALSNNANAVHVLVIEAVLTFLLVTTIFGVAVDKRGPKNVYGFAIGLTVAFDILAAGPITGASMNPARSFGPALVGGYWDIHWAYWVGPVAGAIIAAAIYDGLFIPEDQKAKSE